MKGAMNACGSKPESASGENARSEAEGMRWRARSGQDLASGKTKRRADFPLAQKRGERARFPDRTGVAPMTSPTNPNRRRLLRGLAALPPLSSPQAFALPLLGKKKIRDFGKIYDYLKNSSLRLEETGRQRITIENADFVGEKFYTRWGYCDFVNCDFTGAYNIMLKQLADCSFTGCNFQGIFGFGNTRNTRSLRCKINGESHLGFSKKTINLVFEESKFINANSAPNHIGSVGSVGEATFIACKGRNFSWGGYGKLMLRNCTTGHLE
jgi:hypothetical protein